MVKRIDENLHRKTDHRFTNVLGDLCCCQKTGHKSSLEIGYLCKKFRVVVMRYLEACLARIGMT